MSSKKKWICNGKPKNPQYQGSERGFEHPSRSNYGKVCIECGLPREAVVAGGERQGIPSKLLVILLTSLTLSLLVFAAYSFLRPDEIKVDETLDNGTKIDKPIDDRTKIDETVVNNLQCELQEPEQNPELFSAGERTLFPDRRNPDKNLGIEEFLNQNYTVAQTYFQQATEAARNDPESWIFMNNAKARELGCPLTVALVVPITNKQTSAKEMMRGVADAQEEFNKDKRKGDRLLQVLIINDGNEIELAKNAARYIVDNPAIIAVIGHNSSDATDAALPIYEKAKIPTISPTSTSTDLRSSVFFRTVPSDAATAQVLGEYAQKDLNSQKIVVFYDGSSLYSKSLLNELENFLSSAEIIKTIQLNIPNLNVAAEVSQSIENQVDTAILFPSTQTTAIAIRVAKEVAEENKKLSQKEQMRLLAGDALYNPDTLINGGNAVEDMIVAVPLAPSPAYEKIADHWGGRINWRSTASFDAITAIVQAINKLNSFDKINRQDILEQLPEITVSSTEQSWQFDNGERNTNPSLAQATRRSQEVAAPRNSEFGFKLLQ